MFITIKKIKKNLTGKVLELPKILQFLDVPFSDPGLFNGGGGGVRESHNRQSSGKFIEFY